MALKLATYTGPDALDRQEVNGIDLTGEKLLTLKEAARLPFFRTDGKPRHVAVLYRWASPNGVRGVRLETVRVGGTTYTSLEAARRFVERLSNPTPLKPTDPTPSQRARQIAAAESRLAAAGI